MSETPTPALPDPHASSESSVPAPVPEPAQADANVSRRSFLSSSLSVGTALTAGAAALPALASGSRAQVGVAPAGDPRAQYRKNAAYQHRLDCARNQYNQAPAPHPDNGDEARYPDKIGSYSKGLPHNSFGEVDVNAYAIFVRACAEGDFNLFETVPSGEAIAPQRRKQVNPMGSVAFELQGKDSHDFGMRPPPPFASAEQASEMVEDYWMALLRDVPFEDYATNPLALAACADLSAMSDFRGPKVGGVVTPATLFRSEFPGCLVGPYLSQFYWKSQPFGAQAIGPRIRTVQPGSDFMTSVGEWLASQNGRTPGAGPRFDNTVQRYIRNGRDLAEWLRIDQSYQGFLTAALHLMTPRDPFNPFTGGGLGCQLNSGNPYRSARFQDAFTTFGGPYIMTVLAEAANQALKAVWFQKWRVHRKLRPEAFGGAVHHKVMSGRPYPIHTDVLKSPALTQVFSRYGTLLLPQAYPEGSPLHPSYGAGHAAIAGACTTILKAMFEEVTPILNPVTPAPDGLSLVPYTGAPLTVAGELNKLASNVAVGRNIAGIHWRCDATDGILLGEEVAIALLRDQKNGNVEPFQGFSFTKFDGTRVTV